MLGMNWKYNQQEEFMYEQRTAATRILPFSDFFASVYLLFVVLGYRIRNTRMTDRQNEIPCLVTIGPTRLHSDGQSKQIHRTNTTTHHFSWRGISCRLEDQSIDRLANTCRGTYTQWLPLDCSIEVSSFRIA
jgi:hypothetical protein